MRYINQSATRDKSLWHGQDRRNQALGTTTLWVENRTRGLN